MTSIIAPPDTGEYLTTQDLAHLLDVRVKTIHNWRYKGVGPRYVKQGGVVRYHRDAINEWRERHEVITHA